MQRALLAGLLLCCSAPAGAQESPDNAEMAALVAADQAARDGGPVDWSVVGAEDAARRARTRALLEQGALTTAADFDAAALVFQHGDGPDDFLLAHVLATRAIALGRRESEWIAASALDRYLQSIGRGQVYGTQASYSTETGATQEPYDKSLLPDSVRVAAGAHTLAEQEARVSEMEAAMQSATIPAPNP